jgi:hypothetical protein
MTNTRSRPDRLRRLLGAGFAAVALGLGGCASLVASTTAPLAVNLSRAILDQTDPETVQDGAPAYLLLIDSLIVQNPKDTDLLIAGARLYSAYAAVFVADPARARRLTERARDYGERALCRQRRALCGASGRRHDDYLRLLAEARPADVAALYAQAGAWAGWIEARGDDWNAIADLPKVEAAMRRVVELDEAHAGGAPYVYLGVLTTLRPPALGGRPEEGRRFFERAIALSQGRDLMAKVQFARRYARLTFDRALHDRLLNEVLAADARAPGLTLINTLAQRQARELLAGADAYF